MTSDDNQAIPQGKQPSAPDIKGNLVGTDHIGDDDSGQGPEDEVAVKLPIEEGDFNSQPS